MVIINDQEFPSPDQLVAHVDRGRCDGCAICVDICPTNALEVRENKNRPGHRVVFVTPRLCEGCGVCQGTCPKEAIFIPGFSLVDLRRMVKEAIEYSELA
jgi:heterodisulfide reductase subunit A